MNDVKSKLGIKLPTVDPLLFLSDDEIRPFSIDKRQDLTGTGSQACPQLAGGQYIVHEHDVPEGMAEVVLGVFPHVWQRTNVATANEGALVINPALLAGYVLFMYRRGNAQLAIEESDYNVPTIASAAQNNNRDLVAGTTFFSADPTLMGGVQYQNPLTSILLPSGSKFRVLFSLAEEAATSGIQPYAIGGDATVTKRIDFAGAKVVGVRMPQQTFDILKTARRAGLLGPEARGL